MKHRATFVGDGCGFCTDSDWSLRRHFRGEGIYENTFVRENGRWKYRNLLAFQTFYTTYEQGWAQWASPIFAPYPDFPPDQPQTVDYDPYPDVFVPPFHYPHPVTGRPVPSQE